MLKKPQYPAGIAHQYLSVRPFRRCWACRAWGMQCSRFPHIVLPSSRLTNSPRYLHVFSALIPYGRHITSCFDHVFLAAFPSIALQGDHLGMIGLAAFMGLSCSEEEALRVWQSHQSASSHGDYTTFGLAPDTLESMNATMARLLPPAVSLHWGVTPTDL